MATKVTKNVQLPYAQAFDRLYHTIVNAGYGVSLADPQRGIIKFDSQASLTDWGFNFTAQISAIGTDASQILFTGDVKFGLDAFKVGNKRIEQLMKLY